MIDATRQRVVDRRAGAAAPIREARTPADIASARSLFEEYAGWLGVDLCFQGFAAELATLPGAYAPPGGRLLLAGAPSADTGCIALRPLAGAADAAIGEVKRLYVRPAARGAGTGFALVDTLLTHARAIGYRELKLDTLPQMATALALYRAHGFRECPRYYDNPLPGAIYLALTL